MRIDCRRRLDTAHITPKVEELHTIVTANSKPAKWAGNAIKGYANQEDQEKQE